MPPGRAEYPAAAGLVLNVLAAVGGSVSVAAARLGVTSGNLVDFIQRDEAVRAEANRLLRRRRPAAAGGGDVNGAGVTVDVGAMSTAAAATRPPAPARQDARSAAAERRPSTAAGDGESRLPGVLKQPQTLHAVAGSASTASAFPTFAFFGGGGVQSGIRDHSRNCAASFLATKLRKVSGSPSGSSTRFAL